MIKWTKIDIGDGEAVWYSDCLEYQIIKRNMFVYINEKYFTYYTIVDDSESIDVLWDYFFDLSSAKQWCEEHKAKLTKRG